MVRKDGRNLEQILSGVGDLLKGLSGLAEQGAEMLESADSELGRTRVTYGWSVNTASGDRPRRAAKAAVAPEAPPPSHNTDGPLHEVFDEGEFVRTVIEVPGVVDGDIRFELRGQELTVEARRQDGRCITRLRVPVPVSAEGATSAYRNGMFEIQLPKRQAGAPRERKEAADGSR